MGFLNLLFWCLRYSIGDRGLLRLSWRVMRFAFKTFTLVFLVTLPINFLAISSTLYKTYRFANFSLDNKQRVRQEFRAWLADDAKNKHQHVLDDSAVAPFYVPHLRDPTTWWMNLGGPWSNVTDDTITPREEDVSKYSSLQSLYHEACQGTRWHHWVYVSHRPAEAGDGFVDAWDEAFDRLMQHHYANPSVGAAEFHWTRSPFIRESWLLDGPALLHLTTETPTDEVQDPREHGAVPGFESVTARIIELPVKDMSKLALLPGTFPSHFDQLVGITGDTSIWEAHERDDGFTQLKRRGIELFARLEVEIPGTYGRLARWDRAWGRMLGLEGSTWMGVVVVLSGLVGWFVTYEFWWIWGEISNLMGRDA